MLQSGRQIQIGREEVHNGKERLEKQIGFILEADKEKNVIRQTHLSGNGRRENDAEHAWHMAMMVYLLKEYANYRIIREKN